MNQTLPLTNEYAHDTVLDRDSLIAEIGQALRQNTFSNRMLLSPRRLEQIAREEAAALISYLETPDRDQSHARGRLLAQQGLGHRALLEMSITARRVCLAHNGSGKESTLTMLQIVDSYVAALLEGYMIEREEDLRREQHLTQEAYARAVDRQKEENSR